MNVDESTALLERRISSQKSLSTFFAIVCILDVFGVFPVVTLPKPIIDCGFYGIFIILTVCLAQIYTAILLSRSWVIAEEIYPAIRKKSRYPYAALMEVTYGRKLASFVTFLLDLTIFSASVPNLIVASHNLQLFGSRISSDAIDISYCYWIIILGFALCPVLWLGSPKDMKCICTISVGMVAVVFLLISGCLLTSPGVDEIPTPPQPNWEAMLKAYGIIAFLFDIHPSILTILMDMNDKKQLPSAVFGGFGATLFMFGIVTLISSFKYGTLTQSSILEMLPTSIPLHFAALLVALQLCLTSAIGNSALYQQMEECMKISRDFNLKRCIVRTTISVLAIVIAESVPNFDIVMSIIGGTLTSPLIFLLPPLIYVKMLSLQSKHHNDLEERAFTNVLLNKKPVTNGILKLQKLGNERIEKVETSNNKSSQVSKCVQNVEKVFCIVIVLFFSGLTVSSTYLNLMTAEQSYSNNSMPCIYNVTMELLYL